MELFGCSFIVQFCVSLDASVLAIHRLDRLVSGLLILARNASKADFFRQQVNLLLPFWFYETSSEQESEHLYLKMWARTILSDLDWYQYLFLFRESLSFEVFCFCFKTSFFVNHQKKRSFHQVLIQYQCKSSYCTISLAYWSWISFIIIFLIWTFCHVIWLIGHYYIVDLHLWSISVVECNNSKKKDDFLNAIKVRTAR